MATANADKSPPSSDWWKLLGSVGGVLPAIWGLFTCEHWLFVVFLVFSIFALLMIWHKRLPAIKSTIAGPDGNLIDRPRFGSRWMTGAGWTLLGICISGSILWYFFGAAIIPSAKITRFEPSLILFTYGPKYNSRHIVPERFYIEEGMDGKWEYQPATRCAILTVSRNGDFRTKFIRIESIQFQVKHTPFFKWDRPHGVSPDNIVFPNRFSAKLAPYLVRVKAVMLDPSGEPTEGTIVLDEKHKFTDIHLQVEGETGLYELTPFITISDDMGKHRMEITTHDTVFVGVLNKDAASRQW